MTTPIGPWPLGIDNISATTAVQRNEEGHPIALVDAANVDIDRNGRASRRAGLRQVAATPLRRLWSGRYGAFAQAGATLYRVDPAGLEHIAELNSADDCSYAELAGEIVVGNRTTLYRIRAGAARPVGAPDAPPPTVTPAAAGGLDAGRYAVGIAFVADGEEGSLSPLRFVDVEEGGGILLADLPAPAGATSLRIYRTTPNGTEPALVTELPAGMPSYHLGAAQLGRPAETRNLRQMPPGEHVAAWNGRLLIAHGRVLRFSEPMQYGLHSPRHGFVQLPDRITMVAPVEAGVFVGTTTGVVFLRGSRPREWTRHETGGLPPVPGALTTITSGETRTEAPGQRMALWLAPNGLVLGTEEGTLIELQASRLQLPTYEQGALCVHQRRAIAAVA